MAYDIPKETLNCKINTPRLEKIEKKVERIEEKVSTIPMIEKLMEEVIATNYSQSETLEGLNITLTKVNINMEHMNKAIEKTQQDVEELKKERNINIVKAISTNWWKILIFGMGVFEALKIAGVV